MKSTHQAIVLSGIDPKVESGIGEIAEITAVMPLPSVDNPALRHMMKYSLLQAHAEKIYSMMMIQAILEHSGATVSSLNGKISYPRDVGFHLYIPEDEINLLIVSSSHSQEDIASVQAVTKEATGLQCKTIMCDLQFEGGDVIYLAKSNKILFGNSLGRELNNNKAHQIRRGLNKLNRSLKTVFGELGKKCSALQIEVKYDCEVLYYHLDVFLFLDNDRLMVLNLGLLTLESQKKLSELDNEIVDIGYNPLAPIVQDFGKQLYTINGVLPGEKAMKSQHMLLMLSTLLEKFEQAPAAKKMIMKEDFFNSGFKVLDTLLTYINADDGKPNIQARAPYVNGIYINNNFWFPQLPVDLIKRLGEVLGESRVFSSVSLDPSHRLYHQDTAEGVSQILRSKGCVTATARNLTTAFHLPSHVTQSVNTEILGEFLSTMAPSAIFANYMKDAGLHCLTLGPWPNVKEFFSKKREADCLWAMKTTGTNLKMIKDLYSSLLRLGLSLFPKQCKAIANIYYRLAYVSIEMEEYPLAKESALLSIASAPHWKKSRDCLAKVEELQQKHNITHN